MRGIIRFLLLVTITHSLTFSNDLFWTNSSADIIEKNSIEFGFFNSLKYGLTDNITLIGKIPFSSLIMNNSETENGIQFGTGAKNSSIGDLSFGFRYGLKQDGWLVFALASETEFATGDYTNKSGESNITPTYSPLLNGMCIPIYIDELPVFAVITLLNINFQTKYDIVQKLEPLISVSQNLFAMYDTCHLAKRSAELLDKRAEEHKQLANAKTAFLANMSHEIRTPLN